MKIIDKPNAPTATPEQKQFFDALEKFPRIAGHWNRVSFELDISSLEKDIRVMSPGESANALTAGVLILSDYL